MRRIYDGVWSNIIDCDVNIRNGMTARVIPPNGVLCSSQKDTRCSADVAIG